jgi:hypothetical protein
MPNRTWTPATLYKRLREVLADAGVDISDDARASSMTLAELREMLKQRIVDDAIDTAATSTPATKKAPAQ